MEFRNFMVKFIPTGFNPGTDISLEEWNNAICEYVAMYSEHCNTMAPRMETLEQIWKTYEDMKEKKEEMGDDFPFIGYLMFRATQTKMEIDDNTDRLGWIEKWYKDAAVAIDMMAEAAGFQLRSRIHRIDEENRVVYGAMFKNNPKWTIDVELLVEGS